MKAPYPVMIGWLLPAMARAADAPAPGPATLPTSPLNLLLGLGFLLALVVVAWWLVRRMGGLQVASRAPMRVLGSLPLGTRERVVLVQVGEQQLLLGVAPGRVSLLHRLEEPVAVDSGGGDFADRMRQVLQQGLGR